MVAMVSMSNPGLTILPTHRLIFDYDQFSAAEILDAAADFFAVEELENREDLEKKMADCVGQVGCIGLACSKGYFLLRLTDKDVMEKLAPNRVLAWRELDVSILHVLLLEHIMQIDPQKIDDLENIKYLREPDMGFDEVNDKETSFLFILNATRIEQVKECTRVGEKMPQKSTDFYPKIITGFVMLPIKPDQVI
jgi:uncharacterized protein (DUF1015 family)